VTDTESRPKPQRDPDAMTLAGHLMELRRRIIICVITLCVTGTAAFVFYPHLLAFMQHPYCVAVGPKNCSFYVTAPLDGLSLRFKLATFGGLLLASPVILWEFWRFITPGLKANEKRYAIPFILATIVLFLAGCALAYYSFSHALKFLIAIGGPSLKYIINPNQYLSLILLLMVMYGIAFIFPVLLVSLELAGVVRPAQLLRWWRPAVIVITVLAAVFTPTGDPLSMLLLMCPLIAFYFASIGIGKLLGK
jgi:sec-independent protein translocase protein TatC